MTTPLDMARRVARRALASPDFPGDDDDLIDTGAVDSMGWIGILSAIEQESGISDLGARWPPGRPRSIRVLAELLAASAVQTTHAPSLAGGTSSKIGIRGWGAALGSEAVTAQTLDLDYALPPGTIGKRTGLESVAKASASETEVTLAQQACQEAFDIAQADADDIDLLIAASETFLGFPSLAATLHGALLLPDGCWALDVGGGCLALLNALAAARSILASGARRRALVVAADVHSRRFAGTSTPWQLAALFGDGAGAILLDGAAEECSYTLREFVFGCAGSYASAIRIAPGAAGDLSVEFHGQQLADAAIGRLSGLVEELAIRTGVEKNQIDGLAIHEPNPRALDLVARRSGIPLEKFAQVSRTCGNLGSATCAVGLCRLLTRRPPPRTILLAALGPGLLWGGSCVTTEN